VAGKQKKPKKSIIIFLLSSIIVLVTVILITVPRVTVTTEPEEEISAVHGVEEEPEKPEIPEPAAEKPDIYIVIDDVGYNLEQLQPFLEIPVPITFSILPHLQFSAEAADMIRAAGKEYILHLPMEASGGEDPGPGALFISMSEDEIKQTTVSDISSIPYLSGANNHMGSLFTSDKKSMKSVLSVLKQNSMFFLDSYTTASSVVQDICEELDMDYIKRDVFLDNSQDEGEMKNALEKGLTVAEAKGSAVMIGHVWSPELPEIISRISMENSEGFEFGFISEKYNEKQL